MNADCKHPIESITFGITDCYCKGCYTRFHNHIALISACAELKTLKSRYEKLMDYLVQELDMTSCIFCKDHFRESRGVVIEDKTVCPKCYDITWQAITNEEDFLLAIEQEVAAGILYSAVSKSTAIGSRYLGLRKEILTKYPAFKNMIP